MTKTCLRPEREPTKLDGPAKKLVRRVVQAIKPTHAMIRFDAAKQLWAVLDDNLNAVRHFAYGTMENVTFEAKETVTPSFGCGGGSTNTFIGVAKGDLRENTYGSDASGYRNLSFDANRKAFVNESGKPLTSARSLRLLPNRQSVYKE